VSRKKRAHKAAGPIRYHGKNPALTELRRQRARNPSGGQLADLVHRRARGREHDPAHYHENLGLLYDHADRRPEAIREYEAALAFNPALTDVRIDLCRCYQFVGNHFRAMAEYETAVQDPPTQVTTKGIQKLIHVGFQMWSHDRSRFPWPVSWAEELVRREPQSAKAHLQLGNICRHAGRIPEAIRELNGALALDPRLIGAWADLGRCYLYLGDIARAKVCHNTATRLPASGPRDRLTRALTLTLSGRLAEGWRAYQSWDQQLERLREIPFYEQPFWHRPRWTGKPIPGRLLLHGRGGFGDLFMSLRFVPLIRACVGALRLKVHPHLVDFIAGQPWDVEVRTWADDAGDFDAWTHTERLPGLLCRQAEDLPAAPYLHAPSDFEYQPRLEGTFKVGLVWAGNRRHIDDEYRSTRLADWAPVLEIPGVSFYSLQLGPAAGELEPYRSSVTALGPHLYDWTETATALRQLDLLISIDSAVANLAGALARPVWMCLAAVPDDRWMLERTDTPWYGSARLFRQPRGGDWGTVFAEVIAELRQLVSRAG
jgi:tetratricopeptide (TPR) repeat protein